MIDDEQRQRAWTALLEGMGEVEKEEMSKIIGYTCFIIHPEDMTVIKGFLQALV